MDRIARKRQLRAMLDALRLPSIPDDSRYDALLSQLGIDTASDRDILCSALLDAVYDCRRRGCDDSEPLQFLIWLGGYLPE